MRNVIEHKRATAASRELHDRVRRGNEFHAAAIDQRMSAAADLPIDLEKTCARFQHAIAVEIPLDLQATGSVRLHDAMIGKCSGACVDRKLVERTGGGDDAMGVIYESELAATKVATTIDRVVDVSQCHIGARSDD